MRAELQAAYGQLPLSFEANQGQVDPHVQFLTRGHGHTLFLTPSDAVLALRTDEAKGAGREGEAHQGKPSNNPPPTSRSAVRMTFEGANPQAEMVGLEKLPGIVNYFIGADPSNWRTNIPTYQKVAYTNVYPGIDLVYYGNQGQLEYDLIVAPGADPTQITLAFDGVEQMAVDVHGDLVLTVPQSSNDATGGDAATLRLHKPVVYQRDEQGEKHLLAGTYVLLASEPSRSASAALHRSETSDPSSLTPHVAFQVAAYDASQPLIIDPVLSWATYLGGSGTDIPQSIAVDQAGQAYVTGYTNSSGFPGITASSIQSTNGGGWDGFVAKIQFVMPVSIDIKPGSFPNSINLGSNGVVPVAILGSATFDASQVDPLTVTMADAKVKLKGKGTPMASLQDVNGDGFLDLVVQVSTSTLVLNANDTEAIVEGATVGGTTFRGKDSLRTVP